MDAEKENDQDAENEKQNGVKKEENLELTKSQLGHQAYVQGIPPLFYPPFQKSSEIADFVGKFGSKCGTNKGVSKEGVSPKHRPK